MHIKYKQLNLNRKLLQIFYYIKYIFLGIITRYLLFTDFDITSLTHWVVEQEELNVSLD